MGYTLVMGSRDKVLSGYVVHRYITDWTLSGTMWTLTVEMKYILNVDCIDGVLSGCGQER